MSRFCTILTITMLCCGIAAANPSLEEVEGKIAHAWDQVKSLSGLVSVEATLPIGETRIAVSGDGALDYLKSGDKAMYRQDLTAKTAEPLSLDAKVSTLFDGSDFYLSTKLMGIEESAKTSPDLARGAVPPGGGMLLDALKTQLDLKLLPDATLDESPVFVLEGTPKAGDLPFTKAVISIDKGTGVLRKLELYESASVVAATVKVTGIKLNPPLSAANFIYTPPQKPEPATTDENSDPAPETE